jgi:hypothetical protein
LGDSGYQGIQKIFANAFTPGKRRKGNLSQRKKKNITVI